MASIVKYCGTLTVRGDIKTQFENSGPHPPSFLSLLSRPQTTFSFSWDIDGGARTQHCHPLWSPPLWKICLCLPVVTDLTQLNRPGCNSIRAPTGGLSHGRKARCTADMLHTSTENVNTSLERPCYDQKSMISHKYSIWAMGVLKGLSPYSFYFSWLYSRLYYHSSSSVSFSLRVSPTDHFTSVLFHSLPPTYVWEPVERGHCTNCTQCMPRKSWFYIYLRTTVSLLSPDAVICCSYFINVLLTIIGLKAAKLHIINCNKWKAWGYIYCSTVALLQLWNWFRFFLLNKKKKKHYT